MSLSCLSLGPSPDLNWLRHKLEVISNFSLLPNHQSDFRYPVLRSHDRNWRKFPNPWGDLENLGLDSNTLRKKKKKGVVVDFSIKSIFKLVPGKKCQQVLMTHSPQSFITSLAFDCLTPGAYGYVRVSCWLPSFPPGTWIIPAHSS